MKYVCHIDLMSQLPMTDHILCCPLPNFLMIYQEFIRVEGCSKCILNASSPKRATCQAYLPAFAVPYQCFDISMQADSSRQVALVLQHLVVLPHWPDSLYSLQCM